MQSFEANTTNFSLTSPNRDNGLKVNQNYVSNSYKHGKEKKEDNFETAENKQGIKAHNYGTVIDKSKNKDFQAQLEINQSKLYSLAKKIDECLSASKLDYSTSKVLLQPSFTTLSKSSLIDVKGTEQETANHKPDEVDDNNHEDQILSNIAVKSITVSKEVTSTEMVGHSITFKQEIKTILGTSTVETLEQVEKRLIEDLKVQIPNDSGVESTQQTKSIKNNSEMLSSGLQKKLQTVNSETLETQSDAPKQKESYVSPKVQKQNNNRLLSPKDQARERLGSRSRENVELGVNSKGNQRINNQNNPANAQNYSSPKQVANKNIKRFSSGVEKQLQPNSPTDIPTKSSEKPKPQVKSESKARVPNKQIPQANNAVNRKAEVNTESKAKAGRKTEPLNTANGIRKVKRPSEIIGTKQNFNNEGLEDNFGALQAISPVLNDTKSSKGMKDLLTPGYNFDAANNLSINDLKNISFDSSVLGKELNAKGNNSRIRDKSGPNHTNDQSKEKNEFKNNNSLIYAQSQGKNEKSFNEEDLETSFTKAFTIRKNKLIKDVPNFEERMDSDIYFRRRFQNDLEKFLGELKPKLSEDQAQELYERLIQDSKKREVRARKFELQNKGDFKENTNNFPSISEEQINQTFERLISDARKRILLQEEQEKIKLIQQEELEKSLVQERSKSKMSKEAEERLVMKLLGDAERRRIQYEKLQRAKLEEEIREANELQGQGFKNKNNRAKSKVKEYISARPEPITADKVDRQTRDKNSKTFYMKSDSRSPSVEEITPTINEKTHFTDYKFSSPKKRYLNIASPTNKPEIKETLSSKLYDLKNVKRLGPVKVSPKNDTISSLEYLQILRKNINKHKNDIEEHIQTIKKIDSSSPLRSKSPTQQNNGKETQAKNLNYPDVAPSKPEKPSTSKVSSKYKNVQSKVAQHIEGKLTKENQTKSARDLKNADLKETSSSKFSSKSTKVTTTTKPGSREDKSRGREQQKIIKPSTKFMNDQAAISFVEKLISDFKTINKI